MRNIDRKKTAIILALLMMITCFVAGVVVYSPINWGGDYAQYISQAKAIVNGTVDVFIQDNEFIINNSSNLLGATTYPWGLPCIEAIMMKLGVGTIFSFHIMEVLCVIISGLVVYWIAYEAGGLLPAFFCGSLIWQNIVFIKYSAVIATDICYPAFVMIGIGIAFWLYYKKSDFQKLSCQRIMLLIFLGVTIFEATAFRDGGIVLLIAIFMQQAIMVLFYPQRREIYVLEIIITQICYWIPKVIFERIFPLYQESHYEMMSTTSIQRFFDNVSSYIGCMWQMFPFPRVISVVIWILILWVVVIGILDVSEKYFYLPLLYALGTFALYCLWPSFMGIRFGFSVFMALLVYVPFGLRRIRGKAWKAVPPMMMCICCVAYISKYVISPPEFDVGPYTKEASELFEYINSQTDKNDIIIFQKPRVVYLNTGRLGMQVDYKDFDRMIPMANYIIDGVEDDLGDFDVDLLNTYDFENDNIELSQVYENDKFTMFKIDKEMH